MSGVEEIGSGKPVPVPPLEMRMKLIDEWTRAFPQSSRVVLIGSEEGMFRTASDGNGWRADCLGDMGGFSKTWNHMDNFYLQQIEKTGAQEAWKKAPVAFESCWDMRKWKSEGWNIQAIFDYALRCHASYMNNKSAPLPDGTRKDVERFLKKLGYRLVLRSLEHPPAVATGKSCAIQMEWENVGVAPPYRDYRVSFRFTPYQDQTSGKAIVVRTEDSIRRWVPGTRNLKIALTVPANTPRGKYQLALGLIAPAENTPGVRLAIEGRADQNWYLLTHVQVE
jgi:hypothetical protein